MNSVSLIGRLTKEIDLRQTQTGKAVGTFTLAVQRNYKNQQGEYEADFIQCLIWDKSAENLARFTQKGSQLGVDGRIQTRNYENQQGQKVYVTEVRVDNFTLTGNSNSQNNQNNGAYQGGNGWGNVNYQQNQNNAQNGVFGNIPGGPISIDDDSLPF